MQQRVALAKILTVSRQRYLAVIIFFAFLFSFWFFYPYHLHYTSYLLSIQCPTSQNKTQCSYFLPFYIFVFLSFSHLPYIFILNDNYQFIDTNVLFYLSLSLFFII